MKKICVAEDDAGVQDALMMILSRAGYEVAMYADGHSLLDENLDVPDLFILDRQLSGIDGLEICKELKHRPKMKHVPVIMLSASAQVAELSKEAGADDSLEKPFRMKQLLDTVNGHLNLVGN